jgi:hypothetical protein
MVIFISTISVFGYESLHSFDEEIKIKGYFLLIGSYMFVISAFFDAVFDLGIVFLTIIRIFLTELRKKSPLFRERMNFAQDTHIFVAILRCEIP